MCSVREYIRSDNFSDELQSTFVAFHEENRLHDVTLACDGGQTMMAHRAILCANSRYFKNVLTDRDRNDVVVIMRGYSAHLTKLIIDFMYYGRVTVKEVSKMKFLTKVEHM